MSLECTGEEHIAARIHDLAVNLAEIFICEFLFPCTQINSAHQCFFSLFRKMSDVRNLGLTADIGGMGTDDALARHPLDLTE